MKNRLSLMEVGGRSPMEVGGRSPMEVSKKDEKVYKNVEEEIKYIQENNKDWREVLRDKSQKVS